MTYSHPNVRRTSLALLILLASGCATTHKPQESIELPAKSFKSAPDATDGFEVYDAEDLLKRADDLFDGALYQDATAYYERVVKEFPEDKAEVARAHFSAAEAYLRAEDGDAALRHANAFIAENSATNEDTESNNASALQRAHFKRGAAYALLTRYQEAADVFDVLIVETENDTPTQIEALVDSGVAHFMLEDNPTAEHRFLKARRLFKNAERLERIPVKYFVAQASFYLAEISRIEYDGFHLRFPSKEELKSEKAGLEGFLGDMLEEKCQKLIRAQVQYLRVIREGHVGWASAAGFKVGSMYEALYGELTQLPIPEDLNENASEIYRILLRDKVMVLLEKAVRIWQSTSDMAIRTGADNLWIEKSRASLERVKQYVFENAAEAKGKT